MTHNKEQSIHSDEKGPQTLLELMLAGELHPSTMYGFLYPIEKNFKDQEQQYTEHNPIQSSESNDQSAI